jgi:hypothetical protein
VFSAYVRYLVAQSHRTNKSNMPLDSRCEEKDSEMNGRKQSLEDSLQISPNVHF